MDYPAPGTRFVLMESKPCYIPVFCRILLRLTGFHFIAKCSGSPNKRSRAVLRAWTFLRASNHEPSHQITDPPRVGQKQMQLPFGPLFALIALGGFLVCAGPALLVILRALSPDAPAWTHIVSGQLGAYLATTFILLAGTLSLALPMGVVSAYLTSATQFPGVRFFGFALILPLALPSYIGAAIYGQLLDVAGPVQSGLRALAPGFFSGADRIPIRSLPGAIFVLSLILYPYIFLAARAGFVRQSRRQIEAATLLRATPRDVFWRVMLPGARPAIMAGAALVFMETAADYGASGLFGVQSLAVGVVRSWESFFDLTSAARLSGVLILLALFFIGMERHFRARARFGQENAAAGGDLPPTKLRGVHGLLAFAFCAALFAAGFAIPCLTLILWSLKTPWNELAPRFMPLMAQSGLLAGLGAGLTLIGGAVLARESVAILHQPHHLSPLRRFVAMAASLGYACPGAVLAIGCLSGLSLLRATGITLNLTGVTALICLLIAYQARFTASVLGPVQAALLRVDAHIYEAARSLGADPMRRLRQIEAPIIRPALLIGALAAFVEILKELPATLLLRPFGLETLSVQTFLYAKEERYFAAAIPALLLVGLSLIPIILANQHLGRVRFRARADDQRDEPSDLPLAPTRPAASITGASL